MLAMTTARAIGAVAAVVLLSETVVVAQVCAAADGPVRCQTCTNPEFSHVNVMTTLPRLTYTAGSVSSNLGQYTIFDCTDATNPDTPCELSSSITGLDVSQASNPPAGSILLYGHSVAAYAAFAIICGVLLPLLAVCFCICRCHLTCMLCGADGGCFCCGHGVPTRRRPDAWCGCGFVEIEDPLGKDDVGTLQTNPAASDAVKTTPSAAAVAAGPAGASMGKGPRFHYPCQDRWLPRVCLILNVVCVAMFGGLQYAYGSAGITSAMKLVASSADAIVPVGNGLYTSVRSLAVDVGADIVAPFVLDANATIHRAGSPRVLINSLVCVVDGIQETSTAFKAVTGNLTLVLDTLGNVSTDMDAVASAVSGINASVEEVAVLDEGPLKADLTALGEVTASAAGVTANATAALDSIELSLNNFTSPTVGLPAVSERLGWYNSRPTPAESTAVAADMTSFNDGSFAGAANDGPRGAAVTRMASLASKAANLSGIPSLVVVLRGLNRDLDTFQNENKTGAVIAAILATEALIDKVPNVTRTLEIVNNTVATVDRLLAQISGVRTAVTQLETTVQSVDLSFIDTAADVFDIAETILVCVQDMRPVLDGFDRDIMKLPSVFDTIDSQLGTVNSTLDSARGALDSSVAQKATFESTLTSFNFSQYLTSIDGIATANTSSFGQVSTQASGVSTSFGAANFTSLLASVRSVEASLSDPSLRVNETTLAQLTAVAPVLANLSSASQTALSAVTLYDARRCSTTGGPCTSPGDCTGAGPTCEGGLGKCINADGSGVPGTALDCVADAGCPGALVCSRKGGVFQVAKSVFEGYAVTSTPDLTAAAASISSFSDSVNSVDAVASGRQSIADVNAAVEPITFDPSSATAQIDSAAASAESARPTLQSISDVISSVRGTLSIRDEIANSTSSFDSATAGIESATAAIDPIANGGVASLRKFEDFWYGELGSLLSSRLSRASLDASASSGGLAAVVLDMAYVADRIVAVVADVASSFAGNTSALDINVTELVLPYTGAMNALGDPAVQAKGGLHYALTVGGTITNASNMAALPVRAVSGSATGDGVLADASGAAYPDGEFCFTTDCLDKTITNLNQDNVDVAVGSLGSLSGGVDLGVSIPLNRELVVVLPVTLPLLVALFGLLPVLCCCKCGLQPCCTRCLTTCNQLLSCCCASCLFVFFGALLFPLVMVLADGCRSAPNVGFVYVDQSEAFICDALTGSLTLPGRCAVQVSSDVNVNINLPRLYTALLGQDGCSPAETAEVTNTFTALSGVVDNLLENGVNTTVVDAAASAGFDLRAPMISVLLGTSRAMGQTTFNLLSNLGNDALSCSNINAAISGIYEGMCCGMTNPFYWFVSTYFLMAFSLCCCGWGGSMLGYKRLPNELWGKHYEEALMLPQNKRNQRLQERQAQRASMTAQAESAMGGGSAKVAPEVTAASARAADGEDFSFSTPIGAGGGGKSTLLKKKRAQKSNDPPHAAAARPSRGGGAL